MIKYAAKILKENITKLPMLMFTVLSPWQPHMTFSHVMFRAVEQT